MVKNNSLKNTHPILAEEWHPTKNHALNPRDVSKGSHKKVWWLCSICGDNWEQPIRSRLYLGCPKCVREMVLQEGLKKQINISFLFSF